MVYKFEQFGCYKPRVGYVPLCSHRFVSTSVQVKKDDVKVANV